MVNAAFRIGNSALTVQILDLPPYVVGLWVGSGGDAAQGVALEATGELLARPAERLVLDLGRFSTVSDEVVATLARAVNEAHRMGRDVCLVRASADLFRRLQRAGVTGTVSHAGSLLAATQGLAGQPASSLDIHIQSCPQFLHRLRTILSALSKRAGLPEVAELELNSAVTEAAANAIRHGSPQGTRNHVRVSVHLDPGVLIVDVADQGPGFDPDRVPPPVPTAVQEHGYGLHMMRSSMDRVEFFQDDRGMLVRMTKFLSP